MGITYYNSNPVPVEYTENEMKEKIQGYIAGCDGEFSFKSLCHYIVKIAIKEGKVKDAKYTQYSSNEMSPYSSIQVSKILWEMICLTIYDENSRSFNDVALTLPTRFESFNHNLR